MDRNFEMARDFFLAGVQHYEQGRYAEAERQFAAALALVPGRPSALVNLGAARLKLGRTDEALAVLEEALAQEPDNAEALAHQGAALAETGRLEAALASFDRSLAAAPAQPVAWMHRGTVLRDMGRADEAARSFENALAHGGDKALNEYHLASLQRREAPPAPPREYVQALFDGYAPDFERHVAALGYDAPRILAAGLTAGGRRLRRVLDLGCGTGLCGRLLKPHADAVDGIDLSANMLDRAAAANVYALLDQADIADYLRGTDRRYDAVVAADVMIYVGALEPVFTGVARVLEPGGRFALTLEKAEAADMELRPSLRYAHSEPHVREVAARSSLRVDRIEAGVLREEQREPVQGLFVWLSKV